MITLLPPELLREVCEWLYKVYPASVPDLALTNKKCYAASVHILLQTIRFHISGLSKLPSQIEQCRSRLMRETTGLKLVRRLVITGDGFDDSQDESTAGAEAGRPWCRLSIRAPERADDDDANLDHWLDDPDNPSDGASDEPLGEVYRNNDKWLPLAQLVEQMTALSDLVFGCENQIPPCLLEMLHRKLPACKLRMNSFQLRSLGAPRLDAHEYRIITSPNLYSIRCVQEEVEREHQEGVEQHHDGDQRRLYEAESVMAVVAGLAPNLKQVRLICRTGFQDKLPLPNSSLPPRESIIRLDNESARLPPFWIGSLEHLHLSSRTLAGDSCLAQLMMRWQECTDLSALRVLRLGINIPTKVFEDLRSRYAFPSLTTLVVNMARRQSQNDEDEARAHSTSGCSFLKSMILQGLSTLQLEDWDFRILSPTTVLGPSLKVLRLTSNSTRGPHGALLRENVEQLVEACPHLEELAMPIWRSKGDVDELAMYTALGRLCRLRRLSLLLMVRVPRPGSPSLPFADEFDRRIIPSLAPRCNGDMRNAFVNAAVDENLARCIFHAISTVTDKSTSRPFCGVQSLELKVAGWQNFSGMKSLVLERYFMQIALSWLLYWDPRDSHCHELLAHELSRASRLAKAKRHDQNYANSRCELKPVYRSLWPHNHKGDRVSEAEEHGQCHEPGVLEFGWRDDWHSWPLKLDERTIDK